MTVSSGSIPSTDTAVGQEHEHGVGRRLVITGVVVAVIAIVAVIDQVATRPAPSPSLPLAGAISISSPATQSSSWYCTGGTTGSGGQAATFIYATNTTDHTVAGTASTTVNTGKTSTSSEQSLSVPAGGTFTVNPGASAPAGYSATTLTFAGGGVAVNQVASGPAGWSTAPCASSTSTNWYFPNGSTSTGSQLTLSLYNPAATDAVVDLSFYTGSGVLQPQPYQGLVVPAGQMVTENVGAYVQNSATVGTAVAVQSGQLVADQLQVVSTGGRSGLSLALGAPSVAPSWYFAQTTDVVGSSVSFSLANPGSAPETAVVSVNVAKADAAVVPMSVPSQSVVSFTPTSMTRIPLQTPYSVTIVSAGGAGLAVSRTVLAPTGGASPTFGALMGTSTTSEHWLVPSPGVTAVPGTPGAAVSSLAVANPGTVPADVTVSALQGGTSGTRHLVVAPHSLAVLDQAPVGGLATLTVGSSVPVVVEEDNVPSGSAGVVASTGLPFG